MPLILGFVAAALGAAIGLVFYVLGKHHGMSSADRGDSRLLALALRVVGLRGVAILAGLAAAFVWWMILMQFVGGGFG